MKRVILGDCMRNRWLVTLATLLLAVTVAWITDSALSLTHAMLWCFAGAVLLWAAGLFRAWASWLLAPCLLPGIYALLVGWVDLRVLFPAALLLALTFASGPDARLFGRSRRLAALLVYLVLGAGVALGAMPAATWLAVLALPLVWRAARTTQPEADGRTLAYANTLLLLWIGYLVHGIVR